MGAQAFVGASLYSLQSFLPAVPISRKRYKLRTKVVNFTAEMQIVAAGFIAHMHVLDIVFTVREDIVDSLTWRPFETTLNSLDLCGFGHGSRSKSARYSQRPQASTIPLSQSSQGSVSYPDQWSTRMRPVPEHITQRTHLQGSAATDSRVITLESFIGIQHGLQ